VITDIEVKNQSIFGNDSSRYYNAKKKQLVLKSTDDDVSLEFSALNLTAADKIQYAYRMNGINKDWVYLGNNRRFVNYANLPSGNYTFEIKATDENGLWSSKVTSLQIIKKYPFYYTWWAYLFYLAIIALVTYFVLKTVANRIRLRNELKISHIEKEKSEELAQIKLRYFTNISHELLTPLTIIMLLIENLQKKNNGDSSQFEIMKDNIIRLKRLIQQILVFRKTESGNMKLKIRQNDVVAFVNNICQSNFKPLIVEKEIAFSLDVDCDSYMAYFDPDKLDKVIYNLLSNAFKHTPKKGSIAVKMSFVSRQEDVFLRLSVSDTGNGIAEQDIPHIFKRFYISSTADQSQSHGIGLALTYDLLQIHKGSIDVKSQLGEGAVFTIEIPVSAGCYSEEELLVEEVNDEDVQPVLEIVSTEINPDAAETPEPRKDLGILVVEDNRELRELIADYFSDRYTVLSAENGVQALKVVAENEIDLVISDVMMPEMDGLTLCKILKNDLATSHISVLMLTAKNSPEDRIDCYNAGADSYIAKPFELAVLDARTRNLIQKREQKTENFKSNKDVNISSMEYGSIDEVFLQQAVQKVEDKLADDTFDFDQFAIDMATSKSTLHRKLKSLTGLSPGEFIRNIRLKHAALMLTKNVGNISEIAFAVGFNDPKYFSRCFKAEFGLSPKEYQESKKI
jgi:signal transduction histidine kinase/DNA-binding response OmpR family regulator